MSVPHVRHKKTDGTLYLMGERLGWMVQSKKQNAFSVIHKYADVRSQKISPEGKPKIQLQVLYRYYHCNTAVFRTRPVC